MKKLLLPAMLLAGLVITQGCSVDEPETAVTNPDTPPSPDWDGTDTITISFARPYTQEPMKARASAALGATRAAQSIADICTRLDVWLIHGTDTIAISQNKTDDENFGTVTAVLDKRYTYTLYAVGHKADGAATLNNQGIISWPDDKITHSMYYTSTVNPATTTSLSAEMTRIVAAFKIETTDAIPDEVKKMRFTISSVYNRWSTAAGAGTNLVDRTSEINVGSKKPDGTAAFSVYAICTDGETTHTVTVSALDANSQPVQQRTFTDVKLRNGYRTSYRGQFFTDQPLTATFTVADWNDYDVVDF